ncbi:hypothetical protein CAL26_09160 [Bordetella genomosp. 9]|uniref:Uncharacterized protein n=2 Tax=Bordetella TaxID=517 RepID=A0A261RF04_9BORD|nr:MULTISPECIES: hypothetical protein [Bordetella]ANN78927.1 hypothetical protein BAU07_18990 [Bordetella flabilis]OZI23599.1 hypothetical protein CAL26_09160 [Bordetella genomosp. 9]
MSSQVTREALQEAMRAARCTGDLDAALRFPALRIALQNTAAVLPDLQRRPTILRPRFDVKRAQAGDSD